MDSFPETALRPVCDDYAISSDIIHHVAAKSGRVRRRDSRLGSRLPRLALAALGSAILLAGCRAETAPAPRSERPVRVERVDYETGGAVRELAGVVRARTETDLAFRVSGKIVARAVDVGDRVGAGDVIARLDPQDLRLEVESAEAELAAARTSLAQAAAELERYATLRDQGFAAKAELDRKEAANAEAEGRLERARRALELARNRLAYAELRAGADGVITATLAEPGQVVAVGQPVARLAREGGKEAVVALPETWLAEAREAKATVHLWSDRDRSFEARLRELSPQADPATRTYAARFTILGADDTVAFGMTATVRLETAGEGRAAALPLSAVLNRGAGPSVYVVDAGGTLVRKPVTVARFTEEAVFVTAGVEEGDRVVTLGTQKLEPGLKVRTVQAR